jgi:hypothetical protein
MPENLKKLVCRERERERERKTEWGFMGNDFFPLIEDSAPNKDLSIKFAIFPLTTEQLKINRKPCAE